MNKFALDRWFNNSFVCFLLPATSTTKCDMCCLKNLGLMWNNLDLMCAWCTTGVHCKLLR